MEHSAGESSMAQSLSTLPGCHLVLGFARFAPAQLLANIHHCIWDGLPSCLRPVTRRRAQATTVTVPNARGSAINAQLGIARFCSRGVTFHSQNASL
ncbi:hypothetical protein SKAU_G00030360 [Synaphobranchus kaupii]|uniref:Uncharacterized protein n=1 Tax=Synaphobranchus kaupii TaxID=118154 RepID=A0A9Q1JE15_SYNKA|nr:hypothetical protein SKAU_G00030360 [Synaphobranchus kaupii]